MVGRAQVAMRMLGVALLIMGLPLAALYQANRWPASAQQVVHKRRSVPTTVPAGAALPPETAGPSGADRPPVSAVPSVDALPQPPVARRVQQAAFATLQQRLSQLGAIHFALETSPDDPQQFRCRCRVRLPQTTVYTRLFESTRPDPLAAMREVLQQIENWQQRDRRAPHAASRPPSALPR